LTREDRRRWGVMMLDALRAVIILTVGRILAVITARSEKSGNMS